MIDDLLGKQIGGYEIEARSHNAVAASVATNKADWGIGIETAAQGLEFHFIGDESYDFILPADKMEMPAIQKFLEILRLPATLKRLKDLGFQTGKETGQVLSKNLSQG